MVFVRQVLDVVFGGELALGVGDHELVELQLGLLAQRRSVHQEQDALGVACRISRKHTFAAVKVFPDPVAIWISARG